MKDKVSKFITDNQLISTGDKIIVALSGGADSVSLLYVLLSLKEQYELEIYAFHLNHMLRGKDADNDMDFVKELCEKENVKLYLEKVDINKISSEECISTELAGRNVRYAFLKDLSCKLCAKVATAHTMSDNTETVLFNISRGASLKGASGIPVKRDYLIRPLLCVTRKEIEQYCDDNGLSFVTDKSNFEDIYNRNKIRLGAVPVLKEINEDLDNTIFRFSQISKETDEYITKVASEELTKCRIDFGYDCKKLLSLDEVILKKALICILDGYDIKAESRHIDLIRQSILENTSVALNGRYIVSCKQGVLRIVENIDDEVFIVPFEKYKYKKELNLEKINNVDKFNLIDSDKINGTTVVRNRQSGDIFRLPRRNITKSLRKLMNEKKIPSELRNRARVVANGHTVLWCEYIGASEDGKISINTKSAIKIMGEN